MKTATEIMLNQREDQYNMDVAYLIDQDYIYYTNTGFRLDVLKLADTLTEKQKKDLIKYIQYTLYPDNRNHINSAVTAAVI